MIHCFLIFENNFMASLTTIIITRNEASRIEACLRSIAWSDEIIVLDSGSTDNTVAICKQYTDNVFVTDWPGFGPQKNRALAKATSDWILSLDADERLSEKLVDEIRKLLGSSTSYTAYAIPRLSTYLGKTLKYGDWSNDYCVRLFRRNSAQFTPEIVHEKLQVMEGEVARLQNPIYHQTFTDLEQVLAKVNSYSSLGARAKYAKGQRGTLLKAIGRGLWTFFRGYVLKGGFLDGPEGFMLAVSNAEGTYYRYLKMLYLKE
jgi:glycosyltransferase involved in cell wall biosynthesis